MTAERVLTNARIVTEEAVVLGSLIAADGRIRAIEPGAAAGGIDLEGDYLLPGLVELHTDNLEKHYSPRIGVEWDPVAAAMSHDVQLAGSGITTVLDSVVLGAAQGWDARDAWLAPMLGGLAEARRHGMLKIDHRLHLRCEVTHPEIEALCRSFQDEPGLAMISLMDHAPGDRQSPDIEAYKRRYRQNLAMDEVLVEAHVQGLIEGSRRYGPTNRMRLAAFAREHGLAVASHDDARPEHVIEAKALGCTVSEFPTTLAAAEACRAQGLMILMGAPNLVRGGSHSGNVAAAALAAAGLLDILSSDYLPASLLWAAFKLTEPHFGCTLPAAIRAVSATPAAAVGLHDRGRLAAGLRADLVRVRVIEGRPVVRGVWVAGRRIA